jgi:hypothetical protein
VGQRSFVEGRIYAAKCEDERVDGVGRRWAETSHKAGTAVISVGERALVAFHLSCCNDSFDPMPKLDTLARALQPPAPSRCMRGENSGPTEEFKSGATDS